MGVGSFWIRVGCGVASCGSGVIGAGHQPDSGCATMQRGFASRHAGLCVQDGVDCVCVGATVGGLSSIAKGGSGAMIPIGVPVIA